MNGFGKHLWLVLSGSAILAFVPAAGAEPVKDPITPEMRELLARVNEVHNLMEPRKVDEAVEELHRAIARHDPAVFVPLAVPHLMRLAPREAQTRQVLRRALEKKWVEEPMARALLVQAGDDPGPHVTALLKSLDNRDAKVRARAMSALGECGKHAAVALPKLREVVEKAKADPDDYRRAYAVNDEVPEHVRAYWALSRIEAALREGKE